MTLPLPTGSRAPVVLFIYNRPEHLRRTLESLMRCDGFDSSPVIVYGDGPKNSDQVEEVEKTREVARLLLGDRVEYHLREQNAGLARSVIEGVTDVVNRFGRAIVIEDDLELASGFLTFMNRSLDKYAYNDLVFQISGYMFGKPVLESPTTALFLPFIGSWGWATWERAWRFFDAEATGWLTLRSDKEARRRFNLDNSNEYAAMLFSQMIGNGQSWAIRWYWSVFKANGLVLYPPVSLVRNIGLDGQGTHGRGKLRRFANDATSQPNGFQIDFPERVEMHQGSFDCVKIELRWQNGRWLARVVDTLRWWKVVLMSYGLKL